MRRNLLRLVAIVSVVFTANMALAQSFTYPTKGEDGYTLTQKRMDGINISYNMSQFTLNSLNYRGEEMSEISISAITLPSAAGCPNLPSDSRMMAIPQGATASLEVVSFETQVIENVNIAPALRIQAESEEPDMNFVKDMKVYGKNAFYPENPFVIGSSYIRGVDAVTVSVSPFQYNPVTKQLKVYTNVELAVKFEGGNGHFGDNRLRSPYWDPILATELINYDQLPVIDYAERMQQWLRDEEEGAEYLIITPNNDAWAEYANQLKEYRTRQGIITKVYRLDEMPAANTNELKAWLHNAYRTWDIAPVAVCLLADHGADMGQYIPGEVVSHPSSGNCITDNRYADPSGDNLPDMVFTRLTAQNEAELPIFVSKQIEYEYTQPNMDPNSYTRPVTALGWQTVRWFQLCSEIVGGYFRSHGYDVNRINCIYEGTPGNQWSTATNTASVTNYFGPTGLNYIPSTPSELGDWNSGTPEQIVQAVNAGTFLVQHRDHGLEQGWGEPAMRNGHVTQTTNVGKLPFVMSINCLTGKFNHNSDCFAEVWMRHTYNDENAGAVGLLCPTEVSYSFVNDAYVWGVYDLFDPDFMPSYGPYANHSGNWLPAFGNVAGKYFLQQSNWPYNTDNKDITYTMFTAHCDAFLRLFTQVPQTMAVTHSETVIAGLGEMNVSAPEGCTISLVARNAEGEWEILAVEQASGNVQTISFEPQVPPTIINLVITGQNYLRYEDEILVVPAEGPYIAFNDKVINDENGNGQLDYGETISLDITLKNVGSETMDAFDAVLTTESEYINIINGSSEFASIEANATQTVENAFSFTIADNVPDNTNNAFLITIVNGETSYVSRISMKAFAPVLKINNMAVVEINGNGNGRLDAGEDAELHFNFENDGHSDAVNGLVTLSLMSPYISLENNVFAFDVLSSEQSNTASYTIHVSDETPTGYLCPMTLDIAAEQYTTSKNFIGKVGLIVEDFENGELGEDWNNDSNRPWTFVGEDPYEGELSLRSGAIGNNATTTLVLNHEAGAADTISFFYKVSSESNYDKMHFFIDNQEKGNWSGSVAWTKAAYPVSQGRHTYKWTYQKDGSVNSGSDCCWIDYISLPAARVMAGTAGNDIDICQGFDAQIIGYATNYDNLLWTTAGDGTFNDATIATPIYTPGSNDIANGSVVLTITINGVDETITDNMTLNIHEGTVIENAIIDTHYCEIEQPQPVAVTVNGDYSDFRWHTTGSGSFDDDTAIETHYTPTAEDFTNGFEIYATIETECGTIRFDYPFDMMPAPSFSATNLTEQHVCQGDDFMLNYTAMGAIDGYIDVIINDITYRLTDTNGTLALPTAQLEPGVTVFNCQSISNGYCNSDQEFSIEVTIDAKPSLTVAQNDIVICSGETATIELNLTGVAPFTVELSDHEPIYTPESTYTLTLSPTENTIVSFTSISDGNCTSPIEANINITILGNEPLTIEGETELDAYLTPSAEYTIAEDVMVNWSIEPAEAGTLTPANNGKTVIVNWAEQFKGEVTLTATPTGCEVEGTPYHVIVRNSYDVDENSIAAKLYPNPTNGNITIQADRMQRITVTNAIGQVLFDNEVDSDSEMLNMSQFGTGVFVIRIVTGNGTTTTRVNVIQ